jgi:hypothetical protein
LPLSDGRNLTLADPAPAYQEIIHGKDYLRQLILQLRKDFQSAGIPVKLYLNHPYTFDELVKLIQTAIESATTQQVFHLLYRIDISEEQLKKEMKSPGIDLELIAMLIVKRELQKVVLRMLYSQNNP